MKCRLTLVRRATLLADVDVVYRVGILSIRNSSCRNAWLWDGVYGHGPRVVLIFKILHAVIWNSVTDNKEDSVGLQHTGHLSNRRSQ